MADLNDITDLRYADKITERTMVSSDGKAVHVRRTQNCDPVLQGVQGARDLPKGQKMRHVASIPLVLYHKWMVEAGIQPGHADVTAKMNEVIRRKVQSNEFARLMVHGY